MTFEQHSKMRTACRLEIFMSYELADQKSKWSYLEKLRLKHGKKSSDINEHTNAPAMQSK